MLSQWNWDALRCQDRSRGSHLGSEIDISGTSVVQKWLIVVWAICRYQRYLPPSLLVEPACATPPQCEAIFERRHRTQSMKSGSIKTLTPSPPMMFVMSILVSHSLIHPSVKFILENYVLRTYGRVVGSISAYRPDGFRVHDQDLALSGSSADDPVLMKMQMKRKEECRGGRSDANLNNLQTLRKSTTSNIIPAPQIIHTATFFTQTQRYLLKEASVNPSPSMMLSPDTYLVFAHKSFSPPQHQWCPTKATTHQPTRPWQSNPQA
ncbi:hypothetical protein BKA59DRAFT_557446 [Fusarium tricinctum]|uniref:Uncharacterized protein n=1 Tax=Fusarium tricinctum TaxID=61284 RepID=A0A8K0RWV9_9HYPO|nr:hypothetical protein BKA59DRAFT_557446 [Fusarium tricinctum]